MKVATALQMSSIDEYLIKQEGYSIEQLIEIAGEQLTTSIADKSTYLLLVGPGNNGADALALAKHLLNNNKIVKVKLFYFEKANQIVRQMYEQIKNKIEIVEEDIAADIIVDGIFGNGLDRPLDQNLIDFIIRINAMAIQRIAIDIPTGINATFGILQDTAFKADQTITFMCLKLAMLNEELQGYFGQIIVKPFGIEKHAFTQAQVAELIERHSIIDTLRVRQNHDHKGINGRVLHFTGCQHYKGAACLASLASVYSGSGIVKVCSEESVLLLVNQHNLEAITATWSLEKQVLEGQNAILCGCGSGWDEHTYETLQFLLQESTVPLIIDADGINIISEHLDLLKNSHAPIILTPHLGEFKRLCPHFTDLESAIKHFADTYHVTLVVKGPQTIVYGEHQFYRNSTGNPGMAVAGMGDVLAGIITSFCGQGYSLLEACKLGVYIHGLCGDDLYKTRYTVLPHDLIKKIPVVMKELSNEKDFNWDN